MHWQSFLWRHSCQWDVNSKKIMWRPWILSLLWISFVNIRISSKSNNGGLKYYFVSSDWEVRIKKLQMALDEKEKTELKYELSIIIR
jgi:hypothetical protein